MHYHVTTTSDLVALLETVQRLAVGPDEVVVKREDLRGIGGHIEGPETGCGCPACHALRSGSHAPDCWLAAALKEPDHAE